LQKKRVLPLPLPPITRMFLFLAYLGCFGLLDIVIRSVCVMGILLKKSSSTNGAISAGVPHEAFCQVLFAIY
jgi:hypothetical protein